MSGRLTHAPLVTLGLTLLVGAALVLPAAVRRTAPVAAAPLQQASATPKPTPKPTATPVLVGGKIAAEKACYVRLPDMPRALYGMFGAYNPLTGVLAAAGGAEKRAEEKTIVYYQLLAIKLNSPKSKWWEVPYPQSVGYSRDLDKGCREGAQVQVEDGRWLSVFGKGGCDHGRFDTKTRKGGDIAELTIGDTADAQGVQWTPHVGAAALIDTLLPKLGTLVRLFATWDTQRNRLIFGQGTYNDKRETEGIDDIFAGIPVGGQYQLHKLDPTGPIPERRLGTCAAYIYDRESAVDGVLVLGGQEGGPPNTGALTWNEVWWLDFSHTSEGEWHNITTRFANQKDMGYRREGACAYDEDTKNFYSWNGRANAKVPDGSSHSGGAWRVNLAELGNPTAKLNWERLAKDNLGGINGRRQIPSVWDRVNKRMFIIGGRKDLVEYKDVWAVYPDVTGDACYNLDPFALLPGQPTPTPEPTETPVPPDAPRVCSQIRDLVDAQTIADAVANPTLIKGWKQPKDPGKPAGPDNPLRVWLSVVDVSRQYDPYFNPLVFKVGCP